MKLQHIGTEVYKFSGLGLASDVEYEVIEKLHDSVVIRPKQKKPVEVEPILVNGPELWDRILSKLPKGCVIAGGAIRDYLLKVPPKDIDVFVYSDTENGGLYDAHDAGSAAGFRPIDYDSDDQKKEYEAIPRVQTVQRHTNIGGFTVDYVILNGPKVRNVGKKVIADFDFGITRGYYDGNLYVSREMLTDLQNQTVTLMHGLRREKSLERFERFNTRMAGNFHLKELTPCPPASQAKTYTVLTQVAEPGFGEQKWVALGDFAQ